MGLLFAAAFLARLVSCLGAAIFGTDSCHYLLMADWMRAGRFHDALLIAYHPMYPLLIAAARFFCATTVQAGNAVAILLGSAAILPLYLCARSAFGRPTAVVAALLYALQPAIVEVQSDVMTEGPFMFFLFGSMWLTWRMMEEPSLERGAALGATAAAAFLTRAEGLLAIVFAIAWTLVELIRRRNRVGLRVGGLAVTGIVLVLMLSPFLLWVKAERGRWGLSVRPSAIAAEKAVGIEDEASSEGSSEGKGRLLKIYASSLFRLSLYGVLLPFYILGALRLRREDPRKTLFYLSFPFGHLGGLLYALRVHTFMSERYVMPGTALLGAVAALGVVSLAPRLLRADQNFTLRPLLGVSLLLLIFVVPFVRCLKVRRQECRSYAGAAQWILSQGKQPSAIVGLEQVAYYCGSRSYYAPPVKDLLLRFLDHQPIDYIVYSDKDVISRPEYVNMLASLNVLEPAASYQGPPGTWKVYIHRVRQTR
jgi:4-amino-4-deoxy-L-arabinose transferase-like glycosyltransferase